jgi:hypothetical protein
MEKGAESNTNTKTQRDSQTVLWQIRTLHTPKRKIVLSDHSQTPNCLQNQNATNSNPTQTQTTKQALLLSPLEEFEIRGCRCIF